MDHVVSPDDVEPIEVIDLEVVDTCTVEGCDTPQDEDSLTCWECKQEFCTDHITRCVICQDKCCPSCAQSYWSDNVTYCSHCVKNMTDCVVCGSAINSDATSTNYCNSHDAYCCHSCYGGDDQCEDCASSGGTDAEMGATHKAPWEARGVHAPHDSYVGETDERFLVSDACRLWGVDKNLSLNQGAADFYLLDIVQHNLDCGDIAEPMLVIMAEEAKAQRKHLIDTYDRSLTGYADMAIGGELRYHIAVGGGRHLPGDRAEAWKVWKLLREEGGPQILLEAAELFEEIRGGGVGGERWATAARILYDRVTGRITPEQWVDRCWTLQHNGGAFTNKIAWGPDRCETGQDITNIIGPAHAGDPTDFRTLKRYASSEARELFAEWWPVANKNRMRWGRPMWTQPSEIDYERIRLAFSWFSVFVTAGWRTPSLQNQKLAAWNADPWRAMRRFKPFFVSRDLVWSHSVTLDWQGADPRLMRAIVNATINPTTSVPTCATVHLRMPGYVYWLCECIAKSYGPQQGSAFKVLADAGIHLPLEYLEAAGLPLELEPF